MFKARYYKADGKKGKARALPDVIFDGVVNEPVMHQVVKAYLSNQRQGTASAKTRSEVRGGSRKPWRQKGTGRARAGTTRASQWVGGGVAFPPIPHSWRMNVPKKIRTLARRSALNDRAEHDRVVIADMPALETPKTRDVLAFIGALELQGKTLFLTDGQNANVYLSSRNLKQVEVLPFGEESVYDVLWANTVIIERSALEALEPKAEKKAATAKPKAEKKAAADKPKAEKKAAADKPKAKKKAAAKKAAPVEDAAVEEAEEAVTETADSEAETVEVKAVAEAVTAEPEAEAETDDSETEEKTDA